MDSNFDKIIDQGLQKFKNDGGNIYEVKKVLKTRIVKMLQQTSAN